MNGKSTLEALLVAAEEVDNSWHDEGDRLEYHEEMAERLVTLRAAYGDYLEAERGDDGHIPECCGGCDTCFSVCGGYHGPERRSGTDRRGVSA